MPLEELVREGLQAPISQLIAVIILLAVAGAVTSVVFNSRRESREINARMQSSKETASITKQQLTIIENQQEMIETINDKQQRMIEAINEKHLAESAAWRKAFEINSEYLAQVASAITAMTAAVQETQRQIAIDFESQKAHLLEVQGAVGASTTHLTGLVASMSAVRQAVDKIMTTLLSGGTVPDALNERFAIFERQLDRVVMLLETTNRSIMVLQQQPKEPRYVSPFHSLENDRPAVPAATDGRAGDGTGRDGAGVDPRPDPA